jgi:hypothetical protein
LPVQAELADPSRRAALVTLDEPGVGDHQLSSVQDVVRDQPVQETLDVGPEIRRLRSELRERFGQAVGDLHVAAA